MTFEILLMDINILKNICLIIKWKNGLWEVERSSHIRRPGRGGAFVKARLRNLSTGETINKNFIEADDFQPIDKEKIKKVKAVYLYESGDRDFFMVLSDYEQIAVPRELVEGKKDFLTQDQEVEFLFYEGKPINISLPKKIKLKVVETADAVRGDSATTPNKIAILETGAKVNVPIFIKQGDTILVNTQTRQYVERAN